MQHTVSFFCALVFSASVSIAETSPSRPFPQHTKYANGAIRPDCVTQRQLDKTTSDFYAAWKKTYLAAACDPGQFYIRDDDGGSGAAKQTACVSEGQGYGMIVTAFMAGHDPRAQEFFDGLFRYYRAHPSRINPRLMAWNQITGCKNNPDGGDDSATDGDLDIAFSLLLADAQWGSRGEINYRDEALAIIVAIKKDEVNHDAWSLKLGDWSSRDEKRYFGTRPSDFMLDHLRSFRDATHDDDWSRVIETCFRVVGEIQKSHSPDTGLIPDFVTGLDKTPVPAKPHFLEGAHDGSCFYNSCRVPFRLGVDFLMTGEPRAKIACAKIGAWLKTATGGDPEKIRAGYKLDGKIIDRDDTSMAFTACFAVGAMCDAANREWLNALWKNIAASDSPDDKYFARTLKMQCLIALSGNWWNPPANQIVKSR